MIEKYLKPEEVIILREGDKTTLHSHLLGEILVTHSPITDGQIEMIVSVINRGIAYGHDRGIRANQAAMRAVLGL
jgi:hypothetical protein